VRIAVKPAPPERVTDNCYLLVSVILLLRKESARLRRDPKDWKHPARQPSRIHLRRLSNAGQFVTQPLISAKSLKAVRIACVGADIRSRDTGLAAAS
jgi:hypothetical protein